MEQERPEDPIETVRRLEKENLALKEQLQTHEASFEEIARTFNIFQKQQEQMLAWQQLNEKTPTPTAATTAATATENTAALDPRDLRHFLNARKEFKQPSQAPPEFKGETIGKKPQDVQQTIRTFLFSAENDARLFNYRADNEPERYLNHPTYVQFAARGLKGIALEKWMDLPTETRQNMTWKKFGDWIQETFGSTLCHTELVQEYRTLQQKGSVRVYVQQFNHVVSAMRATDLDPGSTMLQCCLFVNGLKPELQKHYQLHTQKEDLAKLQEAAIRLDEVGWKHRDKPRLSPQHYRLGNNASNVGPFRPTHQSTQGEPVPMELDSVNGGKTKLTPEQKTEYRAKGWCTFCREKDHLIESCKHPNRKPWGAAYRSVNATEQEFDAEPTDETA